MKTRILETFKITFLALLLTVGIGYVFAAWTPAPANPPNGNTDAPINVGASAQTKTGALTLGDLTSGYVTKFAVKDGSQGAGRVLTSDANGNAKWRDFLPDNDPNIISPIECYTWLGGTAVGVLTYYNFIIANTNKNSPYTRGFCWYVNDSSQTPISFDTLKNLVDSKLYVGSLKGFIALGSGIPVAASVGVSGYKFYYQTTGLGPLSVSGLFVPTAVRIRQALQQ